MKLIRAILPVFLLTVPLLAASAPTAQADMAHSPGYADFQACKPIRPDTATKNKKARTVHFAFLIGIDGEVQQSKITKSSGYKDLDQAALDAFQKCPFHPALMQGQAQISWVMLSYQWEAAKLD